MLTTLDIFWPVSELPPVASLGGCKAGDDVIFGASGLVAGKMLAVGGVDGDVRVCVVTVCINVFEGLCSRSRPFVLCLATEDLERS